MAVKETRIGKVAHIMVGGGELAGFQMPYPRGRS